MIKRPMLAFAVAWLSGLLLCHIGRMELFGCIFCYVAILCGSLLRKKTSEFLKFYITPKHYLELTVVLLILPILFCLGCLRGSGYEKNLQKEREAYLSLFLQGEKECFVTGTVHEISRDGLGLRLRLADCSVSGYKEFVWKGAGGCEVRIANAAGQEICAGNKIRVYGKLNVAREASNPGQFDAFRYYAGQGIYATVRAVKTEVLDNSVFYVTQAMYQWKEKIKHIFSKLYMENEAGILAAMLVGDKTLLPDEIKELYQRSGISHILAISGLHISLLAMGLYHLLIRYGIPPIVRIPITTAFLLFYVLFSGGSTSAWRATIMCLILLVSYGTRRSYDMLSALLAAAIVLTAISPWELYTAGFLLSFGAVIGVAAAKEIEKAMEWRRKQRWEKKRQGRHKLSAIESAFLYSGMITCMTTPVSLLFFYEFSPYGVLLNLLVLPFVSLLLLGGLCSLAIGMFSIGAATLAAGGVHLLLGWYEFVCTMSQKLPFAQVLVGEPSRFQIAGYYAVSVGAFFLFIQKKKSGCREEKRQRTTPLWIFTCLLALAWGILLFPNHLGFRLSFLDVSQGDCIVVTTEENKTLLFDCGSTDVGAVGEYRLMPFLKQQGIAVIDAAIVSHMDADHVNGIKELLLRMPPYSGREAAMRDYNGSILIAELVLPKVAEPSESYLELVALAEEKQVAVLFLEAGERLMEQSRSVELTCLSPQNAVKSENDTSLVFLLRTKETEIWLMGDAGTKVERSLFQTIETLRAEAENETDAAEKLCILKAGHHGSGTSSDTEFLRILNPDIAILSCGYKNRYGHPHKEVLTALKDLGITVYRTDLDGAVCFH